MGSGRESLVRLRAGGESTAAGQGVAIHGLTPSGGAALATRNCSRVPRQFAPSIPPVGRIALSRTSSREEETPSHLRVSRFRGVPNTSQLDHKRPASFLSRCVDKCASTFKRLRCDFSDASSPGPGCGNGTRPVSSTPATRSAPKFPGGGGAKASDSRFAGVPTIRARPRSRSPGGCQRVVVVLSHQGIRGLAR